MDDIIIIRATDSDGSVFQRVKDALADRAGNIIDVGTPQNTPLTFPGLEIQAETGIVLRDGCPVQLNYGEFSMLCHLARHPGLILS